MKILKLLVKIIKWGGGTLAREGAEEIKERIDEATQNDSVKLPRTKKRGE